MFLPYMSSCKARGPQHCYSHTVLAASPAFIHRFMHILGLFVSLNCWKKHCAAISDLWRVKYQIFLAWLKHMHACVKVCYAAVAEAQAVDVTLLCLCLGVVWEIGVRCKCIMWSELEMGTCPNQRQVNLVLYVSCNLYQTSCEIPRCVKRKETRCF